MMDAAKRARKLHRLGLATLALTVLSAAIATAAAFATRDDRADLVVRAARSEWTIHDGGSFTIQLPEGWRRLSEYVDLGSRFVSFADESGHSLVVEVDSDSYGRDFDTDITWHTEFADSARTRFRVTRRPDSVCRRSRPLCSSGNGSLEIFAVGPRVAGRPQYNFSYQDANGERRVRTRLFAELIEGVRVQP